MLGRGHTHGGFHVDGLEVDATHDERADVNVVAQGLFLEARVLAGGRGTRVGFGRGSGGGLRVVGRGVVVRAGSEGAGEGQRGQGRADAEE